MSEDDEFWVIAMDDHSSSLEPLRREEEEAVENDEDLWQQLEESESPKRLRYRLPHTCPSITLELQPLAATDGVWSPVGADAWYASALLASLLLTTTSRTEHEAPLPGLTIANVISNIHNNVDMDPLVVLELGSGAVGLSGLACVAALQQHQHLQHSAHSWKMILTDNDPPVLEQLKKNVAQNLPKLLPTREDFESKNKILVHHLDWADDDKDISELLLLGEQEDIRLVIGSELVYTEATARACTQLLLRLLQRHPRIQIWVVQVTDRYGWTEIVIPTLEQQQQQCATVVRSVPISSEIHDLAATMIPMGGTLDRHAYGAFCISNKE
jgi:predicted nicotinamide N-methyase